MTSTYVVTGASGFVGRAVCARLAASGARLVALSRGGEQIPGATKLISWKGVDDQAAVHRACEGADAVLHLAARVHVMRESAQAPLTAYRAVNVAGTESVAAAAIAAGVGRFVYVSTVKVHGEGRATPYREDDPPAPADPYAQSKVEAEAVVRSMEGSGIGWTILRPPLVYGPGVGGNFLRLLRLAGWAIRVPLPLGGLQNRRSLIYVANLADALATVVSRESARGRVFLVADDEALSTSELIHRLSAALGGRARLVACPVKLLRLAGRALGRDADLDRLLGSLEVDSAAIHRALAWTPPFTPVEGLAETARWHLSSRRGD